MRNAWRPQSSLRRRRSVSTKEIAEAVKKQLGLEIDKKKIVLAEPLKTFGTHEAGIKLHREVQAKLNVKVVEA